MPCSVVESARVTDELGDSEDCFRWARWSPNWQYHDESEYLLEHCRSFALFLGQGAPAGNHDPLPRASAAVGDPGPLGARVLPCPVAWPAFGGDHQGDADDD